MKIQDAVNKATFENCKIRRSAWAGHASIGINKGNVFIFYHDSDQEKGAWLPTKNDLLGDDWEVTA